MIVNESTSTMAQQFEWLPTVRTGSFFATASGGIGWGVSAAVGVALGDRDRGVTRPVVGLIGDGSFQYSVQFTVLGYALTSMETETYRPSRLILLGEDASPALRRSTSLDALVTPSSPPFFIWHTAEDYYVPPEHAYRLASALAASDVPHAVHVFAHGPHGLGLAQDAGDAAIWTTLAETWIHEQASPPG